MIRFYDRSDAAQRLIPHLEKYRNEPGLVLAVPRGGVPIAYHIAKAYNLPLELLMTKKIGHPSHAEFAVGAVSVEGYVVNETLGIPQWYIDQEVKRIQAKLKEQYKEFMGDRKPVDPQGKIVII